MSNEAVWGTGRGDNMCCIVNWFDSKNIWVFHHCTLGLWEAHGGANVCSDTV